MTPVGVHSAITHLYHHESCSPSPSACHDVGAKNTLVGTRSTDRNGPFDRRGSAESFHGGATAVVRARLVGNTVPTSTTIQNNTVRRPAAGVTAGTTWAKVRTGRWGCNDAANEHRPTSSVRLPKDLGRPVTTSYEMWLCTKSKQWKSHGVVAAPVTGSDTRQWRGNTERRSGHPSFFRTRMHTGLRGRCSLSSTAHACF